MAKKALLRDHDNIEILPITRGELVLDSSGKVALHSNEFLASNSRPGLMSAEDKAALTSLAGGTIDSDLSTTSVNPVQNKVVTNAINSIKTSYLKSATVSTNTLTIVDQSNKETKFYNTTYGVVTQAADGLAPKLGTDASATIGTQADEWVLTSTKGSAPTWRKLPVNAFKNDNNNTTYTFASGNGGFTVTPSGGTAQTVSIGKPATAGTADKLVCEAASTNSFRHVWFSYDGEDGRLVYDNDFTYNPATNVLNVGSITGSAGSVAWGNITGRPDSFTPSAHNHTTEQITSLSNYAKATSASDLATSDTLNYALGKLEYTARYAYDWVIGVTATDTDEYINKWSEIVGFLDSVKEGTDILDEFVTRKTTQTITGAKTFSSHIQATSGIDLYGATNYTNLPDSNFKLGHTKGLIHFRETNSTNYWGNAITWAYSDSDNAQAGIYVTTGGAYGSEMWFATTNLFDDGPKAALHINSSGDIRAVRGKFRGTFVTNNGTSSHFVKGDGSLDSTTYATSASLGNYLPLTGGTVYASTNVPLKINCTSADSWSGIQYQNAGNTIGGIGVSHYGSPIFIPKEWNAIYTLYHSGNLTNVSQLTNDAGYLTSIPSHTHNYIPFEQSVNGIDMNTVKTTGFYYGYTMTNSASTSISSFIVAKYSPDWGSQLQLCSSDSRAYIRYWQNAGGVMGTWKTLAYTSDIPTKLSDLTDDLGVVTGGPYLSLTGGTIRNGATRNPLTIDTTNTGGYINFALDGVLGAFVGYNNSLGVFVESADGAKLHMKGSSILFNNNKVWHAGNDGTNSGLDADLLDGKHASDFVLSADFASKELNSNLVTITKSITLTKDWQDTGISINSANFPNGSGTYAVQVYIDNGNQGFWGSYFSGIMSVYIYTTNASVPDDEILLHHASHACSKQIYLKTKPVVGSTDYNKLYIACNTNCSSAISIVFKFKKLI